MNTEPSEREEAPEQRLEKIRRWRMMYVWVNRDPYADLSRAFNEIDFLLALRDEERKPNLTEQDKTRFLERGFTVVENAGHSLRLIKRDDARQAISIKWEDLPALRELITLALDDGPMVIGLDTSGQSAKNAATRMRERCVARVKEVADGWQMTWDKDLTGDEDDKIIYVKAANEIILALESLTLDGEKEQ